MQKGIKGKIVFDEKYAAGLKDLEDFSHIHLLYLLHKVEGYLLEVKPFMDNNTHGVFATRSPKRPNRIGSSVVKLDKIEGNTIYISNIDVLNGTPLLDIKPYVPQLYEDTIDDLKIGWFENNHKRLNLKNLMTDLNNYSFPNSSTGIKCFSSCNLISSGIGTDFCSIKSK